MMLHMTSGRRGFHNYSSEDGDGSDGYYPEGRVSKNEDKNEKKETRKSISQVTCFQVIQLKTVFKFVVLCSTSLQFLVFPESWNDHQKTAAMFANIAPGLLIQKYTIFVRIALIVIIYYAHFAYNSSRNLQSKMSFILRLIDSRGLQRANTQLLVSGILDQFTWYIVILML